MALIYCMILISLCGVFRMVVSYNRHLSMQASSPGISRDSWNWRGNKIRYLRSGPQNHGLGPIVLVHGFGASADYFKENLEVIGNSGYNVYAMDLLGFGQSDKPTDVEYSIDLWKEQVIAFSRAVCGPKCKPIIGGNSIGGLVATAVAATDDSSLVSGLLLLNCAGGMNNKFVLNDELTPWYFKVIAFPVLTLLDAALSNPNVAQYFFDRVRTEENVKGTLQSVYVNKEQVDDDLVQSILRPADDPNALPVFVKILTGEPGTTPDKLLPLVSAPIKIVWGSKDTFTPLDAPYGKFFMDFAASRRDEEVKLSIVEAGHCPHSDAPQAVHDVLLPWLASITGSKTNAKN